MTTFSLYMSFWFMEILISNRKQERGETYEPLFCFNFESSYTKKTPTSLTFHCASLILEI